MTYGSVPIYRHETASIVIVAALIARNQTIGMLHYFNLALDGWCKAR